ncbi:hypothetical protein ACFLW9_01980 [Chloroflexota bacterium]
MLKAIFIIAISCLVITGITTLIASILPDGDALAQSLISLRNAVNTLGIATIAILVVAGFLVVEEEVLNFMKVMIAIIENKINQNIPNVSIYFIASP